MKEARKLAATIQQKYLDVSKKTSRAKPAECWRWWASNYCSRREPIRKPKEEEESGKKDAASKAASKEKMVKAKLENFQMDVNRKIVVQYANEGD